MKPQQADRPHGNTGSVLLGSAAMAAPPPAGRPVQPGLAGRSGQSAGETLSEMIVMGAALRPLLDSRPVDGPATVTGHEAGTGAPGDGAGSAVGREAMAAAMPAGQDIRICLELVSACKAETPESEGLKKRIGRELTRSLVQKGVDGAAKVIGACAVFLLGATSMSLAGLNDKVELELRIGAPAREAPLQPQAAETGVIGPLSRQEICETLDRHHDLLRRLASGAGSVEDMRAMARSELERLREDRGHALPGGPRDAVAPVTRQIPVDSADIAPAP